MRRWAASIVVLGALVAPAAASAGTITAVGKRLAPVAREEAPQVAAADPAIAAEIQRLGRLRAQVQREGGDWVVLFHVRERVRAFAVVDAFSGEVSEAYVGDKAEFPLARGSGSGVAKRTLNAIWLWLPLSLLSVLAFFDRRRPWRLLHLDLAAVALFGVSYLFFLRGNLGLGVPLMYPPLVYMLVRALIAGFRPRRRQGALSPLSLRTLMWLTVVLVAGRVLLALLDPFVIDVGYASVGGAQRILDGLELYTRGGNHFDTYGPLAYLAYVPFALIWPFEAAKELQPAAQAAAIVFDLATVAGLVVLGRRLRGPVLGWSLALAWAACPFTALSLVCSSNDALVAALVVWGFVALRSGGVAGVLIGAAAAAKFSPGFVLALIARGSWRRAALVTGAALAVIAVTLLPLLPEGGVREFYDTTIGFQLDRYSPFSLWHHDWLDPLQTALKVAALGLAVAVAFVPRRVAAGQIAALAAAIIIAEQLPLEHWFYLYLAWSLPLYWLAIFTEHAADERPAASQP